MPVTIGQSHGFGLFHVKVLKLTSRLQQITPFLTSRLVHVYHLDESISSFRAHGYFHSKFYLRIVFVTYYFSQFIHHILFNVSVLIS